MEETTEEFNYKIVTKNNFVIVTLKGQMTKLAKSQLEACLGEVSKFDSMVAILIFKDIENIDSSVLREITSIQQEMRKKNKKFFLTGLSATLKKFLFDKGVIRLNEIQASLEEIICDKNNQI